MRALPRLGGLRPVLGDGRGRAAVCRVSTYTLMQMDLCLSGLAGCYGKVEYPAGVQDAVARIREARPDAVTFNEACSGDVVLIARRTGYHLRFSRVIYSGKPLPCVKPGGRGLFGDAVLTKAAIERTDSQPFKAQAGPERREWLCVSTRVGVDVCTAHLASPETDEVAANDPQCAELRALLARRAAARTVIFGGDVNRRPSCAPARLLDPHRQLGPPGPRESSMSTEPARSAPPRHGWSRPHTPTTTSCWSARTSPPDDDSIIWPLICMLATQGAQPRGCPNTTHFTSRPNAARHCNFAGRIRQPILLYARATATSPGRSLVSLRARTWCETTRITVRKPRFVCSVATARSLTFTNLMSDTQLRRERRAHAIYADARARGRAVTPQTASACARPRSAARRWRRP